MADAWADAYNNAHDQGMYSCSEYRTYTVEDGAYRAYVAVLYCDPGD